MHYACLKKLLVLSHATYKVSRTRRREVVIQGYISHSHVTLFLWYLPTKACPLFIHFGSQIEHILGITQWFNASLNQFCRWELENAAVCHVNVQIIRILCSIDSEWKSARYVGVYNLLRHGVLCIHSQPLFRWAVFKEAWKVKVGGY